MTECLHDLCFDLCYQWHAAVIISCRVSAVSWQELDLENFIDPRKSSNA